MKKICIILMLVSPARVFAGLFISEVAPGTAGADWVEIAYSSDKKESIDISKLFVSMYYGTNEALAKDPVRLYSYDRPETPWDDRFAVVHLTDPLTPDETDATGDANKNGRLDLYCNNYASGLWNGEGCAAIDADDDPSNGMIDFVVWSDSAGNPSATIGKYAEAASKNGQWNCEVYDRGACVSVPENGPSPTQSIVRTASADSNTKNDFALTDFQTPGSPNVCGRSAGREMFELERRKVLVVPDDPRRRAVCSFRVGVKCDLRLRVFTDTGQTVFESDTMADVPPGGSSIEWIMRGVRQGLYPAVLEGSESGSRRIMRKKFLFIVAGPR